MRTFRPPRDQCLSELVEPCAEATWRARGEFLRGGTNSSNPSPSSGESVANSVIAKAGPRLLSAAGTSGFAIRMLRRILTTCGPVAATRGSRRMSER